MKLNPMTSMNKYLRTDQIPDKNQHLIETMAIRSSRYDPDKRADPLHGLLFPHVFQEYNSDIN